MALQCIQRNIHLLDLHGRWYRYNYYGQRVLSRDTHWMGFEFLTLWFQVESTNQWPILTISWMFCTRLPLCCQEGFVSFCRNRGLYTTSRGGSRVFKLRGRKRLWRNGTWRSPSTRSMAVMLALEALVFQMLFHASELYFEAFWYKTGF